MEFCNRNSCIEHPSFRYSIDISYALLNRRYGSYYVQLCNQASMLCVPDTAHAIHYAKPADIINTGRLWGIFDLRHCHAFMCIVKDNGLKSSKEQGEDKRFHKFHFADVGATNIGTSLRSMPKPLDTSTLFLLASVLALRVPALPPSPHPGS